MVFCSGFSLLDERVVGVLLYLVAPFLSLMYIFSFVHVVVCISPFSRANEAV